MVVDRICGSDCQKLSATHRTSGLRQLPQRDIEYRINTPVENTIITSLRQPNQTQYS
jgi:hypothetical protein